MGAEQIAGGEGEVSATFRPSPPAPRAGYVVPEVGQVWRDTDPRGGPTFRIVAFEWERAKLQNYVVVTDLNGNRRRRIKAERLNRSYELLTDCEDICMTECQGACGVL